MAYSLKANDFDLKSIRAERQTWLVAPTAAPDKRMLVGIPVGGRRCDRIYNLLPSREPTPLDGQRAEHLPPGLNLIEIRGVLELVDQLPTGILGQIEEQILIMLHVQIVHDGRDPGDALGNLIIAGGQEIDERVLMRRE